MKNKVSQVAILIGQIIQSNLFKKNVCFIFQVRQTKNDNRETTDFNKKSELKYHFLCANAASNNLKYFDNSNRHSANSLTYFIALLITNCFQYPPNPLFFFK
jgi:hypothetical protein